MRQRDFGGGLARGAEPDRAIDVRPGAVVEGLRRVREALVQPARRVRAERERQLVEPVHAGRNHDAGLDLERFVEPIEPAVVDDVQVGAVLEARAEHVVNAPREELVLLIRRVGHVDHRLHHADEAARARVPLEVHLGRPYAPSRHEPDLVVEVVLDVGELGEGLPLPVEEERAAVEGLLAVGHARRRALREEGVERKALRGGDQRVGDHRAIEPRRADGLLVDDQPTHLGPALQVAAVAPHEEVLALAAEHVVGLDVHDRDVVALHLARHPGAADDRNLLAGVGQTDAAAEEQVHLPIGALRGDGELAGIL